MRPITPLALCLFTLNVLLVGCQTDPNGPLPPAADRSEPTAIRFEDARIAMGSRVSIVVYAEDQDQASRATIAAFAEIARQEEILSDYKDDSESRLLVEQSPNTWHDASPDLLEILVLSREIWNASDGAFDPTVGPITALWRPAFKQASLPNADALGHALERVSMNLLQIDTDHNRIRFAKQGMRLDFGGIGKGFAAQKALDVLREQGCPRALIDLGGDLALGDPPPGAEGWRITIDNGLELPTQVKLANVGVATSGDHYRHVEIDGVRYSHIVDPKTGLGLTRRVAVTVIAPDPWLADSLASAVSVLGEQNAKSLLEAYPNATVFVSEAGETPPETPDASERTGTAR